MNTNYFKVLFHLSLLLLSVLSLCSSLETDTISSNLTLKDPDSIVSQKQIFKLGFFTVPNTTKRYLGIFYAFSEQTIVWIANRENPLNDSSSTITISKEGNLVLINSRNQTVWSTEINPTNSTTTVQILDTGNLVLLNTNGAIIWESFTHITNCFLPTMKLSHNIITGKKVTTSSWTNGSDPEKGIFSGGIDAKSIPQMFTWNKDGSPYWRSGQWNGMILNGIKGMYDPYLDGFTVGNENETDFYFTAPIGNLLMHICLNSSGSIVQAMYDDQNSRWIDAWWAPENECDVYGKCGPFGRCNIEGTPICSCMRGFEPVDGDEWGRGNWSGGCRRKIELECGNSNNGGDGFVRMPFMKVPDFAERVETRGEDECRRRCLGNCSCVAYARDRNIGCMIWSGSLIDSQEFNTVGVDLYLRLSRSELDKRNHRKLYVIIPVVVGFVSISVFAFVAWWWIARIKGDKTKDRRKITDAEQTLTTDSNAIVLKDESDVVNIEELPLFTFETLANATNHFHESNLLGRGGFGPVYKGNLGNGKEIAVKRLSEASGQGVEEFKNEVIVISKLQHRNLVRLLGCCIEKEEKMLIYEYMPNKSLDVCLFDSTHPSQSILNWTKRFSIIEGIGRGLLYLHRDSRLRIIHRDLKPSNVLLGEDWNPKISDFGMARMFGGNQDHANTARVVGTYGYMAPEYALEGRFSEKSDIYSFGVLMLEIIKGKKNTHYYNNELSLSLLGCAWKWWSEGNGLSFADKSIASSDIEEDILRCIQIGLLCVQEVANDRPAIQTVLSMLSREIVDLPPPQQPVFAEKWNGLLAGSMQLAGQGGHYSINGLTLTVLDGR